MHSTILLLASSLAYATAQFVDATTTIPAVPSTTAGIPTIEGALEYDGPPVIGYTGPGGNASIQSNLPAATYQAILPAISFDNATGDDIMGTITGTATAGGTGVSFSVMFSNLPSVAQYGPFVYHIHAAAVPSDGNCTGTGAHLDPTDRGELHSCETQAPQTCQAGDLAGKHGNITAQTWTVSYSDLYLSTDPSSAYFFGNKAIVIHSSNATRLTCANFTLVSATSTNATATVSTSTPTVTPFVGAANSLVSGAGVFAGVMAVVFAFVL